MQSGGDPEVELYPRHVKLFRHQTQQQQLAQARQAQMTTFTGMMGGIGGMVVGNPTYGSNTAHAQPQTPRKYQAYTSCFSAKHTMSQLYEFVSNRVKISRDDLRLWHMKDEVGAALLTP